MAISSSSATTRNQSNGSDLSMFRKPSSSSSSRSLAYSNSCSYSSTHFTRTVTTSPTRVNLNNRPIKQNGNATPKTKRTCACSPTTHPGSFRCALHRKTSNRQTASCQSSGSGVLRQAMANSIVRIGGVPRELIKRRLTALIIKPSSYHQRRRAAFVPRPSRLSIMSKAGD